MVNDGIKFVQPNGCLKVLKTEVVALSCARLFLIIKPAHFFLKYTWKDVI